MTVKELRDKLSMYKDDEEVYIGDYDDLHGIMHYRNPMVHTEEVEAWYSKLGYLCFSKFGYYKNQKQATILVIE